VHPATTTGIFHSVAAAEDAYWQELQRNEILAGKLDELERTRGEKLDNIAALLERILASNATCPSPLVISEASLRLH